jgi:hypothetical protein
MKNKVTEERLYRLTDIMENKNTEYNGVILSLDVGWFLKCEGGDKKGLKFAFPLEHPEYDEKMQSKLMELESSDNVLLKLKSMNNRGTKWICQSVKTEFKLEEYLNS